MPRRKRRKDYDELSEQLEQESIRYSRALPEEEEARWR